MSPKTSNLIGWAFGGFLLLQSGLAGAEKSYWRLDDMNDVDIVIDRSWLFRPVLAEFHPSHFYAYDDDDGSLQIYSAATPDASPTTLVPDDNQGHFRIESRRMGKHLRTLLSDGRKGIAFITFTPLKDEKALRAALAEEHEFINGAIRKTVDKHGAIKLTAQDTTSWQRVILNAQASLRLPTDRFYIHRAKDGEWELYDLKAMQSGAMIAPITLSSALTLSTEPLPEESTLRPLYEKDGVKISTHGTFNPIKRKASTGAYQISRKIPLGETTLYLQTANIERQEALPLMTAIASNVEAGPEANGISIAAYISGSSAPAKEVVTDLNNNMEAHLPEGYEIEVFDCSKWSTYGFQLTEDMTFSCDDPDSHYIEVEDTLAEKEFQSDRPQGGFYIRQGAHLDYDRNEATNAEWMTVLLEEERGFVYFMRQDWHFVRYFRIGDNHIVYYMNFGDDMAGCLREFQRSTNAIQAAESE